MEKIKYTSANIVTGLQAITASKGQAQGRWPCGRITGMIMYAVLKTSTVRPGSKYRGGNGGDGGGGGGGEGGGGGDGGGGTGGAGIEAGE